MRRPPIRTGGTLARALVALALAAATSPTAAVAERWTATSPDGRLTAEVSQAHPGVPLRLTVRRDGRDVLMGALGLDTSAGPLVRGLTFTGLRRGKLRETYRTPVGKRRLHHLDARTLTLSFHGRTTLGLALRVAVADDGIAYRYEMPGRGRVRITSERSSFVAPPGTRSWLQRYRADYEATYDPTPLTLAKPGSYGFPALLQLGQGTWALLTESDVAGRYAASHLTVTRHRPGELRVTPQGDVQGSRPFATPWRMVVLGDLATIVQSDLAESLGGRSQIADTSWIVPGRVAWSWWSDSLSPQSPDRQRAFVDFAARMGWEYVLVDSGWDASWIPALVDYARQRGVRILLWARWSDLRMSAQRAALLPLWRSWGVAGVKLDFPLSDSQQRMAWYDTVARDAAAQHLLVDFHGCTLPRGIQRRWPNVMTMEAVYGAEHAKGAGTIPPAHDATLPFTRNAVGSMDYTPVTFSAAGRLTTAAHEVALSVVFESGLQVFADSPESYEARPLAVEMLRRVPTAWDDTRLLAGYPGSGVTIVRRRGRDWWIGTISAVGKATTVRVPLPFLAAGRRYDATVVGDGDHDALVAAHLSVTPSDALTLTLAADGGALVSIIPRP